MQTKVCSMCGQEKPLEEFVKNSRCQDGRASHCKECHNTKYPFGYTKKKARVEFQPKVEEQSSLSMQLLPGNNTQIKAIKTKAKQVA